MTYLLLSYNNYKNKYISKSHKFFSKEKNLKYIKKDIDIPDKYKNIKETKSLKKILLIQKYLNKYDKILWVDDKCFITPKCDNILDKVPDNQLGCIEYTNLNYNEKVEIKKILSIKNEIIDTNFIIIPKIFLEYLTDENIEKNINFFDYSFGDKLFINYIIYTYNIKYFKLDYSYNGLLTKNYISNEDNISNIKHQLTYDINTCSNYIQQNKTFNLSLHSNEYILQKIIRNLYFFYYKNVVKNKQSNIIGISINNKLDDFYSNGINLNIYIWYDFIKLCGYEPLFITHDVNIYNKKIFNNNYNIIDSKDIDSYYIINNLKLYLSIGLADESLEKYLKHKIKLIYVMLGSVYYNDIYHFISNLQRTSAISNNYDEVWMSPHFEFSIDYIKYRYGTNKVFVCPYFWEPYIVDKLKPLKFDKDNIDVGIVESNINMIKHCIQPIIICDKSNEYIKTIKVFNSVQFKEQPFFKDFIVNTNIFKDKKISFEKRLQITNIYEKYANCIISFSDNCDLNYVTFECFYLGIPIIHNSETLKNYGYYYEKFNTEMGKEKMIDIYNNFNKEEYIEKNKEILHKYSIHNKEYKDWFIAKLS
jgi:hypothetical protein